MSALESIKEQYRLRHFCISNFKVVSGLCRDTIERIQQQKIVYQRMSIKQRLTKTFPSAHA